MLFKSQLLTNFEIKTSSILSNPLSKFHEEDFFFPASQQATLLNEQHPVLMILPSGIERLILIGCLLIGCYQVS